MVLRPPSLYMDLKLLRGDRNSGPGVGGFEVFYMIISSGIWDALLQLKLETGSEIAIWSIWGP